MAAKTLLIVAHAPSPNTEKLAQAAYKGANHPDIDIRLLSSRRKIRSQKTCWLPMRYYWARLRTLRIWQD